MGGVQLSMENKLDENSTFRERTSITKSQLANDKKHPRRGKEQVKPLSPANFKEDERSSHEDDKYKQHPGKMGQLPRPHKRLQRVQLLESVRASLERHGGRIGKQ